jgi:hypothetical protein
MPFPVIYAKSILPKALGDIPAALEVRFGLSSKLDYVLLREGELTADLSFGLFGVKFAIGVVLMIRQALYCYVSDLLQNSMSVLQVVLPAIAIVVAIRIPRRIMMNQLYSELVKEYRSAEMGAAILSIFHFYVFVCKCDAARIDNEYRKKYKKQIEEPLRNGEPVNYAKTLHFQRRLVSQFYSDMAMLRYNRPRLSTNAMRKWFTPKEIQLLAILLYMVKPARAVFVEAGEVPEPPEPEDVPMNDLIYKLYEEVKTLV